MSIEILFLIENIDTATSDFAGMGLSALPSAILYAFVQTAFAEEILFRGFLLKRLVAKLGFKNGNAIQSILFGLLHGIENKASGSIMPSVLYH